LYHLDRIPDIAASLDEMQNECMITLALKITDDTCKMDDYERSVFMEVYDALPSYKSNFFDEDVFDLISTGRSTHTAQIFAAIKPLRQAGMEYITRPNMKAFKAAVREKLKDS
jgi:hypothetical protein